MVCDVVYDVIHLDVHEIHQVVDVYVVREKERECVSRHVHTASKERVLMRYIK
jgi:hypothetical protein